jgi:hypothetical protein
MRGEIQTEVLRADTNTSATQRRWEEQGAALRQLREVKGEACEVGEVGEVLRTNTATDSLLGIRRAWRRDMENWRLRRYYSRTVRM